MKAVVCLPFIYRPYAEECLATLQIPQEDMLVVDNTEYNQGIMRSHNNGVDALFERGADWLVIMSAALRFGTVAGGRDFMEKLGTRSDQLVVEAAGVFGWHLIAFSRRVIEAVGRWDENFSPYGYDDLDYSYRIQLAFGMEDRSALWQKVNIDVADMGMGHSLKLAGVTNDNDRIRNYYREKWGVWPEGDHSTAFITPFNNPQNSVKYWPSGFLNGQWDKND